MHRLWWTASTNHLYLPHLRMMVMPWQRLGTWFHDIHWLRLVNPRVMINYTALALRFQSRFHFSWTRGKVRMYPASNIIRVLYPRVLRHVLHLFIHSCFSKTERERDTHTDGERQTDRQKESTEREMPFHPIILLLYKIPLDIYLKPASKG